jgi:hypothetical protein
MHEYSFKNYNERLATILNEMNEWFEFWIQIK